MSSKIIDKSVFDYLENLKKNNNRDWFNANKNDYNTELEKVKGFYNYILEKLNESDNLEKLHSYRIYRDVRFSKDKTPYKTYFGANMTRATNELRGGYYLHIEEGSTYIGGGFFAPNKDDLKRIRQELELDSEEFRDIINNKQFKDFFGTIVGNELKTSPKGFSKEDPNIDLIRKKQYYFLSFL